MKTALNGRPLKRTKKSSELRHLLLGEFMFRAQSWQSHRLDLVQVLLMVELDGAIRALRHGGSAVCQGVAIFPFSKRRRAAQLLNHLGVDAGGGVAAAQHVVDMQTYHSDQTTVHEEVLRLSVRAIELCKVLGIDQEAAGIQQILSKSKAFEPIALGHPVGHNMAS